MRIDQSGSCRGQTLCPIERGSARRTASSTAAADEQRRSIRRSTCALVDPIPSIIDTAPKAARPGRGRTSSRGEKTRSHSGASERGLGGEIGATPTVGQHDQTRAERQREVDVVGDGEAGGPSIGLGPQQLKHSSCWSTSRKVAGSSSSRTRGRCARHAARNTRCRSPPLRVPTMRRETQGNRNAASPPWRSHGRPRTRTSRIAWG